MERATDSLKVNEIEDAAATEALSSDGAFRVFFAACLRLRSGGNIKISPCSSCGELNEDGRREK